MTKHEKLNYVELPSKNIIQTKAFFSKAFAWVFEDFGPDYIAFSDEGLNGGFFKSEQASLTKNGAALLVIYSPDLEASLARVECSGGSIIQGIFVFPGGRRFHFTEPGGNEFAVWSEIKE